MGLVISRLTISTAGLYERMPKYFLIPQMGHLTPPEKYHKQFGLLSVAKSRQPGFV